MIWATGSTPDATIDYWESFAEYISKGIVMPVQPSQDRSSVANQSISDKLTPTLSPPLRPTSVQANKPLITDGVGVKTNAHTRKANNAHASVNESARVRARQAGI